MNQLINKYFEGKTSLEEEKLIRDYFQTGKISSEHEAYTPMFAAFAEEKEIKYRAKQQKKRRFTLSTIFYTGSSVAAVILLSFWLFGSPVVEGDYAIVNGTRINNSEMAMQIAQEKFGKVSDIMDRSLKPLENMQKVKESLKPMEKFTEVTNELSKIRLKLNQE